MLTLKKLAGGVATTALIMAMAGAAAAQETTSAIRGEVTDVGGAPVADAQVTILHQPSGTTSTTTTGADGSFDARNLRVGGPYLITVQAPGFEAERLEGVNLTLAETTRLNFDLAGEDEVAAVVVTAQRDPSADNTGLSTTLDREDIEGVVSVQRDIRDLARRNILVSQNTRGDQGISIAGSNPRTNRITIDGGQAQDDFGLNAGGLQSRRGPISLDGIEQFTVDAVPIDVENGDFLGGAINIVTRSGENNFEGTAFLNYLNDGLVGDSIRGTPVRQVIRQENYGGFFGGPIVRDRVFFALNGEFYETSEQTSRGPAGTAGFANVVNGITQGDIDRVTAIFNDRYATDYDIGSIVPTTPIVDEKYYVKLDANLNENNRLSFTQRYTNSEANTRTNLGASTAALSSQYYLSADEVYSYALELNSTITNDLSTQIRITHKDNERRQAPPNGADFSDITVCNTPTTPTVGNNPTSCAPTSTIRFGADEFRQSNFLETGITEVQAKAEYSLGDHLFKVGYQGQRTDIFNLFVPGSRGVYYFDSVADFEAGRASQLRYNNAVTGDPSDAAADFRYTLHSLFAQDTVELSDELRFTGGVRFDFYQQDDRPALNENFVRRNGFSNQETYDGLSVLMPRVRLDWEPTDYLEFATGFGLFSGGIPDVFISNSFSNTGVLTAGVNIVRNANGTFSELNNNASFNQALGAAALNLNRNDPTLFRDINPLVAGLQQGTASAANAEVNAILPGFQFPADYKFFFNTTLEAPEGWSDRFAPTYLRPALEGWRLTFDAVVTQAKQALLFRDFRTNPLIVRGAPQLTPDGRLRYDGVQGTDAQRAALGITSTNPGANRDIVALNTDKGESYTAGVTLSREFDNGLALLFGYARQNLEDQTSGASFASTASSLYGTGPAGLDPNEEAFGTGFEEVKNRYKFEASYRRSFIRDLESRFTLFGDVRSGRPVSLVMQDAQTGRGNVFGVNRANHLLYVPDFAGDTNPNDLNVGIVTFADQNTLNQFRDLVSLFDLPSNRILEKGSVDDNPEIYQVDFQYSQQLPGFRGGRTRVVFDLQNVLNLLNDEWGLVEEYQDTNLVVNVQCATATGAAVASNSPQCDRYRYSSFRPDSLTKARDTSGRSLWQLQIGLRYEF